MSVPPTMLRNISVSKQNTSTICFIEPTNKHKEMDHKGILSSAFNMSMGFIPVIISILLCEFITQDTAIYIGTVIGIVGVYLSYHHQ